MHNRTISFYTITLVLVSLMILALPAIADTDGELSRILLGIQYSHAKEIADPTADLTAIEQEFLDLLNKYKNPEDAGLIYAELGHVYGTHSVYARIKHFDFRPARQKQLDYYIKALQYPIETYRAAILYHEWSVGLRTIASPDDKFYGSGEEYAKARREFIVPALKGFKLLLDKKTPAENPPAPDHEAIKKKVWSEEPSEDETYSHYWSRKHKEENNALWQAQQEYDEIRGLVTCRGSLWRHIVRSYSQPPSATDELRKLAIEILQDKEIVDKLIADVEAETKGKSS